ncbi:MAG TPA: phosphoenolpyruvate carboxylase [Spirochaetia bacterium]|nr:phosphoenolpyruvate carboxylase [Spirochaetia bacterium]
MDNLQAFREQVALKYQLYNGLFLALPFDEVRSAGILLPMFADYCKAELASNRSPVDFVQGFFAGRSDHVSFDDVAGTLFKFMQFVERQVLLFDALEDACYSVVRDLDGPGSLRELFSRVESRGALDRFRETLRAFSVRVVLTAHPTQFYPDEILTVLTDLGSVISRNDLKGVNDLLLQMGKTRFSNKERPTPLDEAMSLLYYMENTFYEAIPEIHHRIINFAFDPDELAAPEPEAMKLEPPIRLGFWPGGDRDGNPFVTAELTIEIGRLLRNRILRLYLKDLEGLRRRLTFDGVIDRIEAAYARLRTTLYPYDIVNMDSLEEPTYCEDVEDMGYSSSNEFLADMTAIRADVVRGHQSLFVDQLDRLIYKIRIFGFHFATMDIRQDSRVHGRLVEDLISLLSNYASGSPSDKRYTAMDAQERLDVLEGLAALFPLSRNVAQELPEGLSRETILSLQAAQRIQRLNGEQGVRRYIISNTRNAANVLEVWLLAQCAGWSNQSLTLDIVPLFETIEDLHNAPSVMETLYTLPVYRSHLAARENVQTIMVGFSDGTKDGGYVTANWEIYRAKQRLTTVAREHGVHVIFFDGRGGPPARGGGNTHRFYRSLGRNVESRQIEITVQGQTISSKYGTAGSARHNLEQLLSSGIENNLFPEDLYELTDSDVALLDELSRACNEAYLKLKRHPLLTRYLLEMTPLLYYGAANIGSRPTRRNQSDEFRLEDLRAIPFVGAWSQMKQNVPGYYGLGSGLRNLIRNGRKDELVRLYQESLFFRTLVENASQSLSKTNFPLSNHIKDDPVFGEFWMMIFEEARVTIDGIREISGQEDLLEADRVTRESIALREEMVLPTQVIQQFALGMIRRIQRESEGSLPATAIDAGDTRIPTLQKMVIKSLSASVNASRNAV